jgi:hypothetical protein
MFQRHILWVAIYQKALCVPAEHLVGIGTKRSSGTKICFIFLFYPHDIPLGYENSFKSTALNSEWSVDSPFTISPFTIHN